MFQKFRLKYSLDLFATVDGETEDEAIEHFRQALQDCSGGLRMFIGDPYVHQEMAYPHLNEGKVEIDKIDRGLQ